MLELGDGEAKMHTDLVGPTEEAHFVVANTLAKLMKGLREALPAKLRSAHFENAAQAAQRVHGLLNDGALVLVSASNCVNIWWITRALVADRRYGRSVPARWSLQGERASRA